MLTIDLVPCLSDNYAYLVHDQGSGLVAVVDPSEAEPVERALASRGWRLTHILNTHHHFDHTGGNLPLKERHGAQVVGPAADRDRIPGIDEALGEGEVFALGASSAHVLDIPGHTRGHIAFHFDAAAAVFTGDTLFAMGCGRMFEGTADQMFASLSKLAALPPETRVYCGHEYTEANARFAVHVDPDVPAVGARYAMVKKLRAEGKATIPSTIALERATNPFLLAGDVTNFAARRTAKDHFKG